MLNRITRITTVFDRDYGVERTVRLYDEREVLEVLQEHGMVLIEADSADTLGGFLYFTDLKPVDHCLFFARKAAWPD